MPWRLDELILRELEGRRQGSLLRQRTIVESISPVRVRIGGRTYLNFASNNYLGLTEHAGIRGAAMRALEMAGLGAAASALVTGYTPLHAAAETALARWKGTEASVLLPSGYQASHALIQTFGSLPVRFLLDKLCHASLIDAVKASGLQYRVFPHNGLEKLERLLSASPADQLQVVLTESIFSMDGDSADLRGLCALKQRYPFVLVVDEAHGSGVYGPAGAGLVAEWGLTRQVDVTLVTLSKGLGLQGGAVCASQAFCEGVVNLGRAYIYSTAIAPVIAGAVPAAIEVLQREPERQRRVRALAQRVRGELAGAGVRIPEGDSPIVPVILDEEARAVEAAAELREQGLWIVPIRPPTVPRGTSRLRITLSCAHEEAEVETLIQALRQLQA